MNEPTSATLADLGVSILLADAAQVTPDGKVQAIGLGWSTCPPMHPHAVVVFFDVPWTMTNERHRAEIRLYDQDGIPVQNEGGEPYGASLDFEMGRPPGLAAGSPLMFPAVLPIGPLPLQPGDYRWEVTVNGNTRAHWSRSFHVTAAQPPQ